MKFVKLHSRGGNYLVVASNIAWLRTAENGQTSVGMVGGQPLLVVGSIEEVADQILSSTAEQDASAPAPVPIAEPVVAPPLASVEVATSAPQPVAKSPEPVAPPPATAPEEVPEYVAVAPQPEPEAEMLAPEPEPVAVDLEIEQEQSTRPAATASPRAASPVPARPRPVPRNSASLWEKPAAAPQGRLKVKAGSQRMMGALD